MNFSTAIDEYVRDMWMSGRFNSPASERSYRSILEQHAEDVSNRSPHTTNRDDIKRTLRRWPNPNTQRTCRSIIISFYDWTVEEGIRPYNPARQTRRPRKQPTNVYRLTARETVALLSEAQPGHEERVIFLGICAGLRNAELRGLQGRHFRRPGFIWVSSDIAKGGRERWIPVIPELERLYAEIARSTGDAEYVLPAQRWRDPGRNTIRGDLKTRPMSPQAVYHLVGRVAKRAGIAAHIHPHLLRHAFGDHIAKGTGLLAAQALMGHQSVETTRSTYVGKVTLDELAAAVGAFRFGYTPATPPKTPAEATTGIEPVDSSSRLIKGFLEHLQDSIEPRVELYARHFTAKEG